MKKILLTLVLMVGIVLGLFAQKLTYQAVIRDNNQQLVVNTAVKATVTITFTSGDPYQAEFNGSTNLHGLLSIEFGDGSLVGRDWTGATIAVKVVNSATPSIVYVNDEPRPVSAVPYALSVDGQSIQKYLEEKHYVDLTKLNDTLDAYSTTAAMDARHYLTSDSAVIKTMQNNISRNANSIDNLILHTAKAAIRDSVAGQINDSISNIAAKAHTHDNKALLDTYTQTEANLAEAVSKKHSHENMSILNATTAPYTDADSTKLDGIESGAQKNVQSDWKQTDGSKDDYIKNKPSITDTVNNILTTGKYVTETTLDGRHYLTSDSAVITAMQGNIATNKADITTNTADIAALAGRMNTFNTNVCDSVKNCDFSGNTSIQNMLQQLTVRLDAQDIKIDAQDIKIDAQNAKIDSLAHLVDSLAKLVHGGGEVADGQPCLGAPTVSDGTNTYNTVKIGNQCWMKENLRTTTKRNGVGNIYTENTQAGYNAETYGYYYDWAAVMQNESGDKVRGICPEGWHVPSDAEWDTLTHYVFNSTSPDYKCGEDCGTWQAKSNVNCIAKALASTTGWDSNTSEGCNAGNMGDKANATGFSAVPAGVCFDGNFLDFGGGAYFWSATQGDGSNARYRYMGGHVSRVYWYNNGNKGNGFSVRCLRDAGTGGGGTTPVPVEVSCEQVMECMGDTLGKLNTKIEIQGQKLDSLAHVVDSLAKLPHGGGEVADGQPCPGAPTVSDGTNTYNTVKIGNQCWMKENLRTTTKRNGVGNIYTENTQAGYNAETYGYYYDWAAVMQNESGDTVRGICPEGWHVPSDAEWTQLTDYVKSKAEYKCGDGADNIANALSSSTGWQSPSDCGAGHNSTTLNATGFSAVPAGGWFYVDFYDFGGTAYFWSATQYDGEYAWYWGLGSNASDVSRDYDRKVDGFSVRCLKDEGGSSATLPTVTTDSASTVTNNSAKLYGNVTDMGEKTEVNAGFKYGTSESTLTSIVVKDAAMTATGLFSCDITNLTANTQYYFKAFAANGTDTVYGEVKNFTTAAAAFTCGTDSVKDVDNNWYNTVKIGNQCWMKENLRTNVGDGVYPKKNDGQDDLTPDEQVTYGRLYTWTAMMNGKASSDAVPSGVRGICPEGWHVPSNEEWAQLTTYVNSVAEYRCGGNNRIANALSIATGWQNSYECGAGHGGSTTLNATGFSAVPAGYCPDGSFSDFGNMANFWSATLGDDDYARFRYLLSNGPYVYSTTADKDYGFSVRCLKD